MSASFSVGGLVATYLFDQEKGMHMSEPTDTNAGEGARSGFDLEEGVAAAGDIPPMANIDENVGEPVAEEE